MITPMMAADATKSSRERLRTLWTLGVLSLLMGFASLSTDVYLPALPVMGRLLGADAGTMEFTVTGYLAGFALGQLIWGPVADRYGRRWPTALGILLFTIGSAGCAMSWTAPDLIGWRLVQALGASAGVVLSRAMVRDLYEGDRAAQMLSTLITVMAVMPLVAPLIGGQVLRFASWHAIFWGLVGLGIATLAALFTLPETLPPERRNGEPLARAFAGYGALLRDRTLIAYAATGGLFYVGIYAYISGTPFAYIDYYGVPAQLYGLLFASAIVGIMIANMVNARLVTRFGSDRLMGFGARGAAIAGLITAAVVVSGWGGLFALATSLIAYCAMSGLIVANSIAGALARFPARAGAASALVGALHYGTGILGSAAVGLFADGTPQPLGLVVAFAGLGSLFWARRVVAAR